MAFLTKDFYENIFSLCPTDEPDCITDGATQLRMGLKTVGTALRITIIKKKEGTAS